MIGAPRDAAAPPLWPFARSRAVDAARGLLMAMPGPDRDARQMRLVGIVLVVTICGWLLVQLLGRAYGWPARWAFLADLAAMGAFVWSLIVTWRIWRRRKA